jgi:Zn-dependent protease
MGGSPWDPKQPRAPPPRRDDDDEDSSPTERDRAAADEARRQKWGPLSGLVFLGSVALTKTKWVLGAAKLTKMSSLVSMLASSAAYGFFFGPAFGVGMVGLIAVHEAGHALVLRHYGIPFGAAVFIPFMGAAIEMKGQPDNVEQEAMVAFGGPALGSAGALAVGLAGHATGSQLLISLCDFGLMINLFNMLPIGSMDGGRIAGAISPYLQLAGLGAGGLAIYHGLIHNPIFYLIMMAGGYSTWQRFRNTDGVPPSYYRIGPQKRAAIAGGYVGLIALLFMAMAWNRRRLKSVARLKAEAAGEDWGQAEFDEKLRSERGIRRGDVGTAEHPASQEAAVEAWMHEQAQLRAERREQIRADAEDAKQRQRARMRELAEQRRRAAEEQRRRAAEQAQGRADGPVDVTSLWRK